MSKERLEKMSGGALKEVVPVSGKVLVDGEAKGGVNIYLYPAAGGKMITECRTNADGTYCWATYGQCDGIEAGSYKLAFRLVPRQKRNDRNETSDDVFKNKYSDPTKVDFPLTVAKGAPQKDVNYELTAK